VRPYTPAAANIVPAALRTKRGCCQTWLKGWRVWCWVTQRLRKKFSESSDFNISTTYKSGAGRGGDDTPSRPMSRLQTNDGKGPIWRYLTQDYDPGTSPRLGQCIMKERPDSEGSRWWGTASAPLRCAGLRSATAVGRILPPTAFDGVVHFGKNSATPEPQTRARQDGPGPASRAER